MGWVVSNIMQRPHRAAASSAQGSQLGPCWLHTFSSTQQFKARRQRSAPTFSKASCEGQRVKLCCSSSFMSWKVCWKADSEMLRCASASLRVSSNMFQAGRWA